MRLNNRGLIRCSRILAPLLLLIGISACKAPEQKTKDNSPNVILILADDMAYGDLSFINGGRTRTPNLDRLANESVWFSQAYSAAPVCAPARAALLTGLYPHQTGCVTLGMKRFPEYARIDRSLKTMADVFTENGYVTGLIGKWHCGIGEGYHPMDRGFQEFEGFEGFMVNSYYDYQLDINRNLQDFKDQYLTDQLTDRAIDFVRRHKDEHFFLHLAHYAPHRPLGAPEELVNSYMEKGYSKNIATIYAMIEVEDQGIGRLLDELDRLGIREKTLIIFSSDNGPDPIPGKRLNQGLRGTKYTVYEGGLHVPLMINWKGRYEPSSKSSVIHFTDIFPTLVKVCHLSLTDPIDFVGGSLAGVLTGNDTASLPEARYWQWNRGIPMYSHNAAMRMGKWKLVRPYVTRNVPDGASTEKPVLYDLEKDPYETVDVSPENHLIYENMKVMLEQWSREVEFSRIKKTSD